MTSTVELTDRTWELLQHQKKKYSLPSDTAIIHLLLCEKLGLMPDLTDSQRADQLGNRVADSSLLNLRRA